MDNSKRLYRSFLRMVNRQNGGAIIYTGDPEFNSWYEKNHLAKSIPSKGRLKVLLTSPNLASKEQEDSLKIYFYTNLAEDGLPLLTRSFHVKKINQINSKRSRKNKPTRNELEVFREKFFYEKGILRGWIKAAEREFELNRKTLNSILKE